MADATVDMGSASEWQVRIGFAGLVLNLLGLFVIWRTLKISKASADAAADSAASAKKSADYLLMAERARLSIYKPIIKVAPMDSPIQINRDSIMEITFNFTIKNTGKTPAYQVSYEYSFALIADMITEPSSPGEFAAKANWPITRVAPQNPMEPGGQLIKNLFRVDTTLWDSIMSFDKHAFIWGKLVYQDAFDESIERFANFGFKIHPMPSKIKLVRMESRAFWNSN